MALPDCKELGSTCRKEKKLDIVGQEKTLPHQERPFIYAFTHSSMIFTECLSRIRHWAILWAYSITRAAALAQQGAPLTYSARNSAPWSCAMQESFFIFLVYVMCCHYYLVSTPERIFSWAAILSDLLTSVFFSLAQCQVGSVNIC